MKILIAFFTVFLTGCTHNKADLLTGIQIDRASLNMTVGDRIQIMATPVPKEAHADFAWTADDETVATVTGSGLVAAVAEGSTNVQVGNSAGNVSVRIPVTVGKKTVPIVSISLSVGELLLTPGETATVTAVPVPMNADATFLWSSEDEEISVVTDGVVEAIAAGTTSVWVGDLSGSVTKSVNVTVFSPSVAKTCSDTVLLMTLNGADCPFADHADYGVYIPTRTEPLQGTLILQHGCTMETFGITRPYDLQYQALARKWKLAVVETALHGDCYLWRDPTAGTAAALLNVLSQAGAKTGHPELNTVPWLLFGHSGGGYWTLAMLKAYPERIMAAVCYSPAFDPQWDYPAAAAKVPLLTRHAGAADANANGILCWATSVHAFQKLRATDAPVSIAHNPGQNHNFSYIRYMAIPFYEAVMKQRLPQGSGTALYDLDRSQTWLGDTLTLQLCRESEYTGDKSGWCVLPDEATAQLWKEYVMTGTVADKTPPPPPYEMRRERKNATTAVLSWKADADIESGISHFRIYKNGQFAARFPASGEYQQFDTNGDNTSPIGSLLKEMKTEISAGENDLLSVSTVNRFGLESASTTDFLNR
ncbi:MAG: Ig-like domain-containing protein [Bacteroidales bacterium]|jgi:pimeloyl-ACP methyl ester carboxylesterase|nr:Ig-like domain-containing protein [Bacteroidales bacterium]